MVVLPFIYCWSLEERLHTAKLVDSMLHAKAMDDIKQQIYEASTMDNEKSAQETTTLQARVSDLENENVRLRNETDSLEQYSQRNCLVFHGIPENEKDTTEAVVRICQSKLGLPIDRNCIDRSHRLGRMTGETSPKPRAVIVKLTSYAPRNDIFMAKRKLKGSKIVVTAKRTTDQSADSTKRGSNLDDRRKNRLFAGKWEKGDSHYGTAVEGFVRVLNGQTIDMTYQHKHDSQCQWITLLPLV